MHLVPAAALWHAPAMLPRLSVPLAALLLAGCATMPGQYRLAERDPLEKANRVVWGVNRGVDQVVIKPVTSVYRAVTPKPVRGLVANFFNNLYEPWSFVNNVLQGKPNRAGSNLGRFLVNSTLGIGGLFDPASKMGLKPAYEDLGQTFARWGMNGGPYLILPLLGPSTLRDGIGSGVAFYADPVNIAIQQAHVNVWYKRGYRVAYIVNARSELTESGGDAFLESSLDPYAAARSAFLQRRTAAIADLEDSADAGPPDDAGAFDAGAAGPPDPPADGTTPASPAPSAPVPPAADTILKTPEQAAGSPPPEPAPVPPPTPQ